MAKAKYDAGDNTSFFWLLDPYEPDDLLHITHTSKKSVYIDRESDWSIEVTGSGLKYKNDILIGGTITKVAFTNEDGDQVFELDGFKIGALKFPDPVRTDGPKDMYLAIMKGNDVLTGGSHNDWINGGAGNDRLSGGLGADILEGGKGNDTLTGGGGSDQFLSGVGMGVDTVKDFQATGTGHDYIAFYADEGTPTFSQVGDDTVVLFAGGSKLVLLGVDASEMSLGENFIGGYENYFA